ncbi:MAG TPA: DNA polymerase III subunit gamma/tau [Candidatus Polarisedimenticolia bacterium]|nr:DNA polymerase III subunit gamma/tau [Candidatus Polarisedimenticolia bacterium]
MSYQVLARKYRPQTFEEVVGQKPIVTTLQNAVSNRRIHHAYLFSGLRGVGKTTVARLLAKALNCAEGPTPTPCNACASCREIAECRAMDVLEIDGASNRGIDAVRELRETVRYAPARDRYKIYIIDEVHMLTTEAWNALLKTLEEPPPHVLFVFATTDYRKLPLTILSRCQHFEFKKIGTAEMAAHLARMAEGEKVSVPQGVLDLVARLAEGSLRDAQSALDQVIAFSGATVTDEQARTILGVIDHDLITGFYQAVRARDYSRLVGLVETVFEKGYLPTQFLEDLMAHGRDLLLVSVVPDAERHVQGGADEVKRLRTEAAAWSEDELLRLLELMTREEYRVKNSGHPRFLLEALAIKLARLADLTPIEDLIARTGSTPDGPDKDEAGEPARPPRATPHGGAHKTGAAAEPGTVTAFATLPAPATDVIAPTRPEAGGRDQATVESILKRVHQERGALGGFLEEASWIEIEGDRLVIAFNEKHAFFREKVEARESLDCLRRVAREVSGSDLAIRVTVAAPGTGAGRAPTPAETAEAQKQRLREAAERTPLVRTLLDAFSGQIVDVEQA